jgi:hypothetical protein
MFRTQQSLPLHRIRRKRSTRVLLLVLSVALTVFGLSVPAATAATTATCGIDADPATGFTSSAADGYGVTYRVGCASAAPSDLAALTTSGDDVVMAADLSGQDMSAKLKEEVDAFNQAHSGGQSLSQFLDAKTGEHSLHLYDGATSTDGASFDGSVHVVGNSLVAVVPAAQVSTTAWYWQKLVAGIAGWAAGVVAGSACLAFFNVGAPFAAPVCGAVLGFFTGLVTELITNVVFDHRPLLSNDQLAEAFTLALLGAVVGAAGGTVLEWATKGARSLTATLQTSLRNLGQKFKSWVNPFNYLADALSGFDPALTQAIRQRLGSAQQIAVASYIYPTDSAWTRLINSPTSKTSVVVANVLNGPGSEKNSAWGDVIGKAAASGKKVLGYVDTGYFGLADNRATRLGSTAPADWTQQIEEDINAWYDLYGSSMGGIFFDDGYNECGADNVVPSWYTEINDYVKRTYPGALTVLNPGTIVPQCYDGTADVLLTFEGDYTGYVGTNSNAALNYKDLGWTPAASDIWHIVYGTSADHISEVAAKSKARGAGYIEITDDVMANPYDTLPADGYWNAEQDAVEGNTPRIMGASPYAGITNTPVAPSSLTVKSYDYTSATLTWGASAGAARYKISVNGRIRTLPGSMTTATIGGLTAGGSSYEIKVIAQTGGGTDSAASNTVVVKTLSLPGGKTVSNVQVSATATTATISADFLVPYSFRRLYFWTPTLGITGCQNGPSWTINYRTDSYVCGYYMIEGTTLYKYTGTANSQWSWSPMGTVTISKSGYTYTWNVPYGTSGGVSADHVVLQAEGYNPLVNYFTPCSEFSPTLGPDGNGRYCA